ncbi:hypothetical protein ESY86_19740 [Subsaximicrobium wynnwilliamsii]|uniref:Uncharacterized protein n=1 Tax=Subsaximicrobium wynnwilliamsii TaxID=291179 RepID=A0A5C6ZCC8_9FLAO|nr:hypothetical protein [Subsaximicrobium wynnwilliamsii]TXD80917.1 hypothetical protein ESY87_19820 [Subsaximicrobium wynnwilliamsii]TXD86603.1 hypothetical protein ESY86_19740 [Subsaximicrobium wynnwilliamsii]TXE00200.1 hypothetical protein ESY88_19800 [Subsaximicrobium wynnwilliamsii]
MNRILQPKIITIILFSLLSFVILTLYVWHFSFTWEFVFGVVFYIIFLLAILLIGILISMKIDSKKKSKLKYYFIISFIQLLIIWLLSIPVSNWQIKYSKENGMNIVELVEKYKISYGTYPKSLSEIEQKTNSNIPKWTALGTKYNYEFFDNGNFSVGFKSYYGYDLYYDKRNKKWTSYD